MKRIILAAVLVLATGLAASQAVQNVRPMSAVPRIAAPPAADVATAVPDYKTMYEREAEKARKLRAELDASNQRLTETTRLGGSLVRAYCETPTISRNTAGATSDCSTSGYKCEPVSGLCRTKAATSLECAAGFVYCSKYSNCVTSPEQC